MTAEPVAGRVVRIDSGSCQVDTDRGPLRCTLRKRLGRGRRDLVRLIAVGDEVQLIPEGDGQGVIESIAPRRTQLSRRAMSHRSREQVVAANVDLLVAVAAYAQPAPNLDLLDRSLVAASVGGLDAAVCLNKHDLAGDAAAGDGDAERTEQAVRTYEAIGYPVVRTSAVTGAGLGALRDLMQGHTSVVAGPSGTGKSTLLNALQPGLRLRTADVSTKSGEGRHTTTRSELLRLEFGGYVIDTPGIRDYTIWSVDPLAIAQHLPEFAPFRGACRFSNCTHSHEPDCQVRAALDRGAIDPRRYGSYLTMLDDARQAP